MSAPPCAKTRYRDRIGALIALASTQRAQSSKRAESSVYRCPNCKGWHLTSRYPSGRDVTP